MLLCGPTAEQLTDLENKNQIKMKREVAAAEEAVREREIYRIEPDETKLTQAT